MTADGSGRHPTPTGAAPTEDGGAGAPPTSSGKVAGRVAPAAGGSATGRPSAHPFGPDGEMDYPRRRGHAGEEVFPGYLQLARTILAARPGASG